MLPSRTHAAIDYGVSACLGALALLPALSGRTRAALGGAALYHTTYSALTDYEGGLTPKIDMTQHLALDAVGAAGLCAAGLLLRPRHPAESRLLLAIGLAELAVVALSDHTAAAGPPDTTYAPLDVLKPVADNLWTVDSAMGPGGPVRMTIIRLPNNDLLLHSPTRHDPRLQRDLEQLGRIRHLVAPNIAHWTFVKSWQDALPDARTWAAPGLGARRQVQQSGLRIDHELADTAPADWSDQIEQVVVRGAAGFTEVAMFHRPSRTALLTDLVVNVEPKKLPWLMRPVVWAVGALAPTGRAPAYLRAIVHLNGAAAAAAARRVLAWNPDRVMITHGHPLEHNAADQLRQSLNWLVRSPSGVRPTLVMPGHPPFGTRPRSNAAIR